MAVGTELISTLPCERRVSKWIYDPNTKLLKEGVQDKCATLDSNRLILSTCNVHLDSQKFEWQHFVDLNARKLLEELAKDDVEQEFISKPTENWPVGDDVVQWRSLKPIRRSQHCVQATALRTPAAAAPVADVALKRLTFCEFSNVRIQWPNTKEGAV